MPGCLPTGFHQLGAHPGQHLGGDGRPLFGGRGGAPLHVPLGRRTVSGPAAPLAGAGIPDGLPRPGLPAKYPGLLPGLRVNVTSLRAFTLNRGLPPQVRQVVVVEGWTPEPPSDSPPKERRSPQRRPQKRRRPIQRGHRPLRLRARRTLGAYPPPGTFSGKMVTLNMGPLALGPCQGHLTLMYEW